MKKRLSGPVSGIFLLLILLSACTQDPGPANIGPPHDARFGIYSLDPESGRVELIYSCEDEIECLTVSHGGDHFAFARYYGGGGLDSSEVCTLALDGGDLRRLTVSEGWDIYPRWSPDDTRIAFLSKREGDTTLDIYTMAATGGSQVKLYDSGFHDADIDWWGDRIVFTQESRIWIMGDDGTGAVPISDPPNAGEWGQANLPFGDYDPRFRPDGDAVLFARLEDDSCPHGDYNFFLVDPATSEETRISSSGWTQGLAEWSPSGDRILFVTAAIDCEGLYDLYLMDPTDGGVPGT